MVTEFGLKILRLENFRTIQNNQIMKNWSRRDLIKALGVSALSGGLVNDLSAFKYSEKNYELDLDQNFKKPNKPITAITLGAGNRGNVYGDYAWKNPENMKIVGVAEPISIRQDRYAEKHDIKKKNRFVTWEHVFEKKKFADAIIIATPDHLHYGPAMQALEMGYDLLLEKPIAQKWQECKEILDLAERKNSIVAVCHVLRYSPYYRKIKEVIDNKELGELVSVAHFEPIQHVHMSHSFVRGNWGKEADSNPAILAKSCHDLDMLRWWIGKKCLHLNSFGSLKWFKEENAPEGSTARCTDGCAVEKTCPYSAKRIYHEKQSWLHHFDLPKDKSKWPDEIMKNIKEGPYGRCVYRCDNDVVDHQVMSMLFEDEITASFNMEAFTSYHGRKSRIMGSMGDIVGDGQEMTIVNFQTEEVTKWNVKEHAKIKSGHGGGDYGIAQDFVSAVSQKDASLLTSNLQASMDSHQMAFLAEESRKSFKTMKVS